jgi:thioredoxin 2
MTMQAVCPACQTANRVAAGHPAGAAKCGRCAESLALEKAIDVDDAALAAHLERTKGMILVDVWAPWCGPCRAMAPHFADAARMLAGQARLLKLNADNSQTVRHLGVSGIPALLLFRDGRIIDRKAGLMTGDALTAWVRRHAVTTKEAAI